MRVDDITNVLGTTLLILTAVCLIFWFCMPFRVTFYSEKEPEVKDTVIIQPDIKDTSSYHWTDNFNDAQLREMCKDGTLKLK